MLESEIVEGLRDAVARSEHSPAEIARRAGFDRSIVTRLIHRERGISIGVAERLADALGLELVLRRKRKG